MHIIKFKAQTCQFFSAFVFLTIFPPIPNAFAVQAHGGAEGLVSHEIGHILFILGMSSLVYHIHKLRISRPGWFEFKGFLWMVIFWNFLTFSGHWMREWVTPEKFAKIDGHTVGFTISNVADAFFYLTRLDHLVLVPAFLFLLFALKKWRATA